VSEPEIERMPKEIINRIRNEEYLLDIEGESEKVKRGAESLQKKLNSALRLLSEDLYSKQTHFILELIQNADDNDYGSGIIPMLTFKLKAEQLVLVNNEKGFTEKNVQALCSVGESSKAKKSGYIGEKGIGFKSVFTVSNAPEIHSNGYHFRFDRTDESNLLGYVVPHWCKMMDEVSNDSTTIILPAKTGFQFSIETLEDLDARLLLFLSKLRVLSVENGNTLVTFRRKDQDGVSYLTTESMVVGELPKAQEARFVHVARTFTMKSVTDEKRPDIDMSDVVLAFPVDSTGNAVPDITSQVYAFLPIRQFGFKFSIQADFILSSSREDIHIDRPWNKLLRDYIPTAFIKAVEHFKKTEELAFSYLKYLPSDADILDPFFKPVAAKTIELLTNTKCLLSASGDWKTPKELRHSSKRFRSLFPSSIALELLGFDYVDQRIQAEDELLERLGVRPITYTDLVSVFKIHGDWLKKQPQEWKAKFYAFLADQKHKELITAGLANTPCVPTIEGNFAIPAKTSVFYPLSRGKKYGFEDELTIVDSDLLDLAAEHSSQISGLFAALKVKTADPYELVTSHILPRHKGEAWKNSEHKALIGHLRYIKDKLNQYVAGANLFGNTETQAIAVIRDGIWVGTKHHEKGKTWYFSRIENLYLSKEYNPVFCIESLLGANITDDNLVSPDYLFDRAKDAESEADSWRTFLIKLRIRVAPKLEALPNGDCNCSPELQLLLESEQSSVRKVTLECLDQFWNSYSDYLTFTARVGRTWTTLDTRFVSALRSMKAPTRKRVSIPISDAYYPTRELKELFGDKPTYIDATLNSQGLLDTCQITYRVDTKACIKRLQQLKSAGGDTTPQLHAIYRHLERFWDRDSAIIKQAFEQESLIRIKGTHAIWARPNSVSWRSNSPFLDNLYPPLQGHYRDFSAFFNDKLGIPKELPTTKWIQALSRLDEIAPPEERRREALSIYRRANRDLGPKFGKNEDSKPEWLDVFQYEDVFLNHRDELVANDENLFANDAPELADLFANDQNVSILAIPFEDVPRVSRLLQAAHVQLLSQSIDVQVIKVAGGKVRNDLTSQVRQTIPFIGRVLYAKSHEKFEEAVIKGLFARLRDLVVIEVPELQLEVTLAGVSRHKSADIASSGNQVLIRTGSRSVKDQLAAELCKLLGAPEELADTVTRILMAEDSESIEDFLGVRRIGQLPTDVQLSLTDENGKQPIRDECVGESEEMLPFSNSNVEDTVEYEAKSLPREIGREVEAIEADVYAKEDAYGDSETASRIDAGRVKSDTHPTQRQQHQSNEPQPTQETSPFTAKSSQIPKVSLPSPTTKVEADFKPTFRNGSEESTPLSSRRGSSNNGEPNQGISPDDATPESPSLPPQILVNSGHSGRAELYRPKRSRGGIRQKRTKSGRLMSYAASPGETQRESSTDDQEKAAARNAVGKAAVDYLLATQSGRWKSLTPMEHNNPGFDIIAVTHDGIEEYIEVKGQSAAWTEDGVALTPTELVTAQRHKERFWLCVVEYAQDEKRRALYLLKNPYGLTQQFRFDSGWKSAATSEAAVPLKPEAGLFIDIPGEGKGRILSARKKGQFYGLHVSLECGRQINKIFNPAKMKLSTE
jgi:hypothetical protein